MTNAEAKMMRLADTAFAEKAVKEVAPGIWRLENGCHAFTLAGIRRVLTADNLMVGTDDMETMELALVAAAVDAERVPG